MQRFPLRRSSSPAVGGYSSNRPTSGTNGMPKECRGMSAVTTRRLAPATKPAPVRICHRVLAPDEDTVTWDEVLSVAGKSKSWQSQASSSQVDSCGTAAAAVTTQGPVQQQQQTSARILQVPCIATAATTSSINNNNNNNRNKDDDDNNRRCSYRTMGAAPRGGPGTGAMPAGAFTARREFMTFEQLRLGDQINFLLFDPYRTLKFLITELKSRLRVVAPDDINAHKILVEIQQAVKRIRASNATKPAARTTTATTAAAPAAKRPMPVGCIPPHGRCHVIKEDPLINHAGKVNSSCQTMESQSENVNACQMCEHPVGQGRTAGCNQRRTSGNSDADGLGWDGAGPHRRSKDRSEGAEVEKRYNYKSLKDALSALKDRSNNPFDGETQRIITQLEAELLLSAQGGDEELSFHPMPQMKRPLSPPGIRSTAEHSKVQCKRPPTEDSERKKSENERPHHGTEEEADEEAGKDVSEDEEQKGTFSNLNARLPTPRSIAGKKLDSSVQAAADTTSKEAPTNLKNPTRLLCHLEREKLLLLQQFRAAEMHSIQGDLNELHVLIKDQLNGIYRSITRENLKAKHRPRSFGNKKTRQKSTSGAPKPPTAAQPSSSTPSSTAQTSSALSSNELLVDPPVTTPESTSSPGPGPGQCHPVSGNANITKSMMEQKQLPREWAKPSSSSLSELDAKDSRDISDVDKANKTTGEKKSKDHHSRYLHRHHHQHQQQQRCLCGQHHHHFSHAKYCAAALEDTPCWSEKRIHYSAVECGGRCHHCGAPTAELARTSIHSDAKSTTKTSLAAMTHHQHRQQCQPMTTATATTTSAAQEQTQLIAPPSSRAQPAAPCTLMQTVPEEGAELSLDGMTNAAVRTIIPEPIPADHSNGIRGHRRLPHRRPSGNSWQCVNPKNPACCQLKKQICGNVHEPKINKNNNIPTASAEDDNHSNYPEIHGCQKCRANTVDGFCGLCPAPVHEVGMDNSPPAPSLMQAPNDGGAKGGVVDDVRASGDGPIYRMNEAHSRTTCVGALHIGQGMRLGNLLSRPVTKAFQTDFEEFKEFLDEIVLSTPRLK